MNERTEKLLKDLHIKRKAVDKLWFNFWVDKVQNEPFWAKDDMPEETYEEFTDWCSLRATKHKIYLITINPREDIIEPEFIERIKKSVKKKWITYYKWCIEWRDKAEGMHCHILVHSNGKRISECRREFYNTFKHMVGNKLHVNIRYGTRPDSYSQYIEGIKGGKSKPNHKYDVENRIELCLKDWYESKKQ